MPATPSLDSVVSWIDAYLKIRELPDHDGAVNGLQVENGGSITRVLAAVDALEGDAANEAVKSASRPSTERASKREVGYYRLRA